VSCTPQGCIELLDRSGVAIEGKDAVVRVCSPAWHGPVRRVDYSRPPPVPSLPSSCLQVLGRSNIVGIPVALLLMQRNATVTIAHSRTKDIESVVKRADIVVAAVGRAEFVKASWLKVQYVRHDRTLSAPLFPR